MTTLAASGTTLLPAPPLPNGRPNLVLTGLMGTGKTTAGRLAAGSLAWPFLDLDAAIASRAGRDVPAIFASEGEAGFRERERRVVADAARLSGTVIATGGGAPLDHDGFAALAASGTVAVLTATADELARRLGDGGGRPLLGSDPAGRVRELLVRRAQAYGAAGDPLDTTGRTPAAVADLLVERAGTNGPTRLTLTTDDGTTQVTVGDGAIGRADLRAALEGVTRAVVVSDAAVAATHAARVIEALRDAGIEPVGPVVVPAGEDAKRVEILASLWDAFRAGGLDPSGAVVAVGGGATLDVAGFAAATYARGVTLVNVPTTVLAMADAAVGGKVAIDHAGAKNLVGAFHPARLVIADTATCASLPDSARRDGLAEIVKAGLLASPLILDLVADAPLAWAVEQSLRVKIAYVAADPRDRGVRRALNLGHTYAHAIESASDHAISHGAAVAMGLVAAARLGASLGTCPPDLAARIAAVLERIGLPTSAPRLDEDRLLAALGADKKRAGGAARFVVPAADGAALVSGVDPRDALAMLRP